MLNPCPTRGETDDVERRTRGTRESTPVGAVLEPRQERRRYDRHRTRRQGCYVWDTTGKRYLDGLAGLYTTQAGYGQPELAAAAGAQAETLAFFPIWTYAHPAAVKLAAKLASLAPGDLNRVFFTSGGSEAVESAWKLARQYFKMKGEPLRTKVISRDLSYHGVTMGALSITGLSAVKGMFEPLVPGAIKVPATNSYRLPPHAQDDSYFAEEIEQAILREGPETICAVFLEPVQNAGGCFVPPDGYFQRVREICDQYGRAAGVRRGHLCLRAPRHDVRPASASATSPTSSPRPRASPRATHRLAPCS